MQTMAMSRQTNWNVWTVLPPDGLRCSPSACFKHSSMVIFSSSRSGSPRTRTSAQTSCYMRLSPAGTTTGFFPISSPGWTGAGARTPLTALLVRRRASPSRHPLRGASAANIFTVRIPPRCGVDLRVLRPVGGRQQLVVPSRPAHRPCPQSRACVRREGDSRCPALARVLEGPSPPPALTLDPCDLRGTLSGCLGRLPARKQGELRGEQGARSLSLPLLSQ